MIFYAMQHMRMAECMHTVNFRSCHCRHSYCTIPSEFSQPSFRRLVVSKTSDNIMLQKHLNIDHGPQYFLFLLDLEIFGLTMLEGMPTERDTVTKFAWEKFGYPQFTQYGDSFEVRNKPGPSNVAYTGKTLGLHLDQPIYTIRSGKPPIILNMYLSTFY